MMAPMDFPDTKAFFKTLAWSNLADVPKWWTKRRK